MGLSTLLPCQEGREWHMALQFYLGPSGSGKTYRLYHKIIEEAEKNPNNQYMILVPEQFTMSTQKEIVRMHPKKGILNIDVLSFGRLAFRIFEETGLKETIVLDDIGKSMILRKIASEKEGELKVLGKNLKRLGYIEEVKSIVAEFLQYNIGEKELERLKKGAGTRELLRCKLCDIEILYDRFKEYLKENYTTSEEMLSLASDALPKSEKIKDSVIALDGFTGFTPVQNKLLRQLIAQCRQVIVAITLGAGENPYEADGEQKLFALSKKTIFSLERLSIEAGIQRDRAKDLYLNKSPVKRFEGKEGLAFLEENLFRYQSKIFEKDPEDIRLFTAFNPMEELRQVCIEMKRLIREKGYRYRDFAIMCGDMEVYAPYAKRMFQKYNIPSFLDQNRKILLNPVIEFLRAGIGIVTKDYSYESVFHFARAGFWTMDKESIDLAENFVLSKGIRGSKAWSKKFRKPKKGYSKKEMEAINKFREEILSMLKPLSSLKEKKGEGTVEEMTKSLYEFLCQTKVQELLAKYEGQFAHEGNKEKEKEFHQIYKEIIDLFDKMVELLGKEKMNLKEYGELLDAGFSEIEVGLIPLSVDQILMGDIERSRFDHVKILFFVGLNEGIVPKTGAKGGILSDLDREALKAQDVELAPTLRERAYVQRLYLYRNMTKPDHCLYLSYTKVNGAGQSASPSSLVEEIKRLFPKLSMMESLEARDRNRITAPKDGLDYLMDDLHHFDSLDKDKRELYAWYYRSSQYGQWLKKLSENVLGFQKTDSLSKAVARGLYGKVLENSVTRLEKYAACAYSHFLNYGLFLKERDMFSLEARDLGTIFHDCLEQFSRELYKRDYSWFQLPEEEAEELAEEAIRVSSEQYKDALGSSARNEYMRIRMKRIILRAVKTLCTQAKGGDFVPKAYEVEFPGEEKMETSIIPLSEEEEIHLRGRIDRIDILEDGMHIYVKIIDYKSGEKDLSLEEIFQGLSLQLMVYMRAAMELEKKAHPEKKVLPGGILYYHIEDPLVDIEEGEEVEGIEKKIASKLRMKGMVNEDNSVLEKMDRKMTGRSDIIPVRWNKDKSLSKDSSTFSLEEFDALSQFVREKIKEMGREILSGKIDRNPYEMGTKDACRYCAYKGICSLEKAKDGEYRRVVKKRAKEEIWNDIHSRSAENH